MPEEDVYGHLARVHWIRRHISPADRLIEVGCGTGYRVTFPLRKWGYDVIGVDTDEASIAYGRALFRKAGLADTVNHANLEEVEGPFDGVIISEVLEHLSDAEVDGLLKVARAKLKSNGLVLVTVPNGYGWFELESFLWQRTGLGAVLTRSGLAFLVRRLKRLVVSGATTSSVPSTFSSSPHLQRFTLQRIRTRLEEGGFTVKEATGSVLVCGPISDLLFGGAIPIMRLNRFLGGRFPAMASGFYVAARKR